MLDPCCVYTAPGPERCSGGRPHPAAKSKWSDAATGPAGVERHIFTRPIVFPLAHSPSARFSGNSRVPSSTCPEHLSSVFKGPPLWNISVCGRGLPTITPVPPPPPQGIAVTLTPQPEDPCPLARGSERGQVGVGGSARRDKLLAPPFAVGKNPRAPGRAVSPQEGG